MIRLLETRAASLLPPGRDAAAWYAALSDEIARNLSPAHAHLLARPEPTADGLAWMADGAVRTRYADLPGDARRALDAALGAILSDIRRLAESGVAPAVRAAWPALRDVPDMGHVFAVDGRPVLAGWGHAGEAGASGTSGRLARLDDGMAWRATPRPPWARYGAVLGVLALLGLACGLLLPAAGTWFTDQPAACMVVPAQLQAMRDQAALESRGAQLQTLLATLTDEVGRRQLLCPLPVAQPRPAPLPPAPAPLPPAPAPQPHADLPENQWQRRDLGMLEGCWRLDSGMTVSNAANTQSSRIRLWHMCFDGHGAGRQALVLEDGRQCSGPLAASFTPDDQLRVTEPEQCRGTLQMTPSVRLCRRASDTEAQCDGTNLGAPEGRRDYHGTFRR